MLLGSLLCIRMNLIAHFGVIVNSLLVISSKTHFQGMEKLVNLITTAAQGSSPIYIFDHNNEPHVRSLLHSTESRYSLYNIDGFEASLEQIITKTMENDLSDDFHSLLNFVIFCRTECINSVLMSATVLDETVGQRSLLRHFSTWLIISPDYPSIVNVTMDHVAWLEMETERQQFEVIPAAYSSFQTRNETDIVTSSIKGFYSLMWMPEGREWSSIDTYQTSYMYSSIFPNFKRGLNGRQLSTTALEWSPFTIKRVVNDVTTYVGAALDMFDILAETLNFSYVIEEPEDKSWGKALENISLTGIIGQINRAEVDFCVVPYAVSSDREKFTDISYPAIESKYNALYRRNQDDQDWMYPVSCFSWETYVVGLGTWIAVLCLSLVWKLASKEVSKQSYVHSLIEIGFSVPLRQNIETIDLERMASRRILVFSWCMFCFIVTTVFVGNLVAFSTVEKNTDPFHTLEDIANQNEYGVFVMEGGYAEGVIMTSSDSVLEKINKKTISINSSAFQDPTEIIQHILQKKYIYISPLVFTDVMKSRSCDIVQTKQSFFLLYSGFLFPPFSPLKRIFENEFLQLQEYGTVDTLMKKWTPKAMQCDTSVVMNPQFKLRNLTTIGIVIAVLVAIAFSILLCEIFTIKRF